MRGLCEEGDQQNLSRVGGRERKERGKGFGGLVPRALEGWRGESKKEL